MLRVNVGMSRKLTRDYQSTGFSVNLESELCVDMNDPETVIEKIREVYDLADEALRDQIDRYESDSAIASRDEERKPVQEQPAIPNGSPTNGNGHRQNGEVVQSKTANGSQEQATNAQVKYLLTLGKKEGLSKPQLENRIASILGRQKGIYDLSKSDAGVVLDHLTGNNRRSNRG